jgi:membrane fusion protein (multidrug efflux system)
MSGVVVEQRAYPGEFVYENPIVTIAQINPLRVEAIVPARFFGQIKPGMLASIEPEIHSEQRLSGEIAAVDRLIDTASGTFSVYLELENPDNTIPGGQRCTVDFQAVDKPEKVASVR